MLFESLLQLLHPGESIKVNLAATSGGKYRLVILPSLNDSAATVPKDLEEVRNALVNPIVLIGTGEDIRNGNLSDHIAFLAAERLPLVESYESALESLRLAAEASAAAVAATRRNAATKAAPLKSPARAADRKILPAGKSGKPAQPAAGESDLFEPAAGVAAPAAAEVVAPAAADTQPAPAPAEAPTVVMPEAVADCTQEPVAAAATPAAAAVAVTAEVVASVDETPVVATAAEVVAPGPDLSPTAPPSQTEPPAPQATETRGLPVIDRIRTIVAANGGITPTEVIKRGAITPSNYYTQQKVLRESGELVAVTKGRQVQLWMAADPTAPRDAARAASA